MNNDFFQILAQAVDNVFVLLAQFEFLVNLEAVRVDVDTGSLTKWTR
jgi:hypothetical protein